MKEDAAPTSHAARRGGDFLAGTGETSALLLGFDWANSPLGPIAQWPQSLRTAVGICMNSRFPMFVWWGPELITVYNDAYIPVLGKRHPDAFGSPGREIWKEIWPILEPQVEAVMQRGEATWNERVPLLMERNNYVEETWFTWSYSPIPDEAGNIGGLFCACTEDTGRVVAEKRVTDILDSITDGFFTLDREWRFTYVNGQAERLLDRGPGDLLGKVIWDVYQLKGTEFERVYRRVVAERGAESFISCRLALAARNALPPLSRSCRASADTFASQALFARFRPAHIEHLDTAKTLAKLLTLSGNAVKTAGTVADALNVAAGEPFDLVISDIGLPDATGYDLMQQIRERFGIKGIALSGYGMEEDMQRSREAGFSDHVVKPINLAQLQAVIEKVLQGKSWTIMNYE